MTCPTARSASTLLLAIPRAPTSPTPSVVAPSLSAGRFQTTATWIAVAWAFPLSASTALRASQGSQGSRGQPPGHRSQRRLRLFLQWVSRRRCFPCLMCQCPPVPCPLSQRPRLQSPLSQCPRGQWPLNQRPPLQCPPCQSPPCLSHPYLFPPCQSLVARFQPSLGLLLLRRALRRALNRSLNRSLNRFLNRSLNRSPVVLLLSRQRQRRPSSRLLLR